MVYMRNTRLYVVHLVLRILFSVILLHAASAGASQDLQDGFVWVVEGKYNRVYLAGSIHFLREENYPLPAVYETAYKNSGHLIFEVHPDSISNPQAQFRMLQLARYGDGADLKSSLGDSVYRQFSETCLKLGLNAEQFMAFRPWFVSVSLSMAQLQRLGFEPHLGVDQYFFRHAREDHKSIQGLESFSEQMEILTGLSDKDQKYLLLQTFSQLNTIDHELQKILHAWKSADLRILEEMLIKEFYSYPGLADRLLVQRNTRWTDQIFRYLQEKDNYMIIVGSGHFPGRTGLLNLLKQKGFEPKSLSGISIH